MSSRSEGLAALRARAAAKAAPASPVVDVPQPSPQDAPAPLAKAAGGRPPNAVKTIPVNLHVPEDLMEGLVQIAYRTSTPRRRMTPQKVILDLIRERVAGHG